MNTMVIINTLFLNYYVFLLFFRESKIVVGTLGSDLWVNSYAINYDMTADFWRDQASKDRDLFSQASRKAFLIFLKRHFFLYKETLPTTNPIFLKWWIRIILYFLSISVIDARTTRAKAVEWIKSVADMEILWYTPTYFQYHLELHQNLNEGAERGRAVALYELERYPDSYFLPKQET